MALGNKTLEDLLQPISKQLGHDKVADALDLPEWEFKPERVTDGMTAAQLTDLFVSEAAKIQIKAHRCKADELASCVAQIVGAGVPDTGEPGTVVCADDERFAKAGLYDALRAEKLVSDVRIWSSSQSDIDASLVATFGVTYATAGIAETATVVQPANEKCGRAVSLLPLVHIAVVDASRIVPTMREALDELGSETKLPSQVCFISGPSATADIELVRVEGVHGPMYVHYIVID